MKKFYSSDGYIFNKKIKKDLSIDDGFFIYPIHASKFVIMDDCNDFTNQYEIKKEILLFLNALR